MSNAALKFDTQDILVDEIFPHAPETIWKTLTTGELIARWLMAPTGFEPVEGKRIECPHCAASSRRPARAAMPAQARPIAITTPVMVQA